MSLEQAILDNTAINLKLSASIDALMAISTKLHDLRADAIEKVSTAAASTKGTKKTDDKPAADAAKEPAANISTGGERVDPTDEMEVIKQAVAAYVAGTDREEERTARKSKVKELLNHEKIRDPKVEAGKATGLQHVAALPLFKDQIAKLTAKGDITTPPAAKSDDLDL